MINPYAPHTRRFGASMLCGTLGVTVPSVARAECLGSGCYNDLAWLAGGVVVVLLAIAAVAGIVLYKFGKARGVPAFVVPVLIVGAAFYWFFFGGF